MNTNTSKKELISIIGLGKVGPAMGFLLRNAGYEIAAVYSRSTQSVMKALPYTGGTVATSAAEAASRGEVVIIATPDDEIEGVCKKISSSGAIGKGNKVIHLSGAGSLSLLQTAKNSGADIACIHPLQAFADVETAIANLPGSTFGITCEEHLKLWAEAFVKDLGGVPFYVSDENKPLYHAAACMVSNFLVTLMHVGESIYKKLGLTEEEALRAFWPLVRGTVKNIETWGTVKALTGPIARGDTGTVDRHIRALQEKLPAFLEIYRILGEQTVDVALKKGSISQEKATLLKRKLKGEVL
ncbi:MAG: DUF2520 domain-containing protein [Syntrophales bacterium]|nr:DUF2520 domain-containing protein [Syntrophales bacterium]